MSILDMKLGKSAPAGADKRPATFHGRVPTKPDINFALVGVKKVRWWLALCVLVVILAAAAAIAKFLVLDRLAEVSAAEAEAAQVRSQLDACYERIGSYGELNDAYAHYTYSGMTEEELARVDRVAVMDLLERVVFPRTAANAWTLNGNRLTLSIEGDSLQDVNVTVQQLLADELVSYCEVNTAATDAKSAQNLSGEPEKVTANIIVYLEKPEEAEQK